jgi:hypothetical protein
MRHRVIPTRASTRISQGSTRTCAVTEPALCAELLESFHRLPLPGASGINIIDNSLQNPEVRQFNLGVETRVGTSVVLRVDALHDLGIHFIIGRNVGEVFNPVVGGPDQIKNLESTAH